MRGSVSLHALCAGGVAVGHYQVLPEEVAVYSREPKREASGRALV